MPRMRGTTTCGSDLLNKISRLRRSKGCIFVALGWFHAAKNVTETIHGAPLFTKRENGSNSWAELPTDPVKVLFVFQWHLLQFSSIGLKIKIIAFLVLAAHLNESCSAEVAFYRSIFGLNFVRSIPAAET